MGVTEYPCPKCGQAQRIRAPNGQEVKARLCAACQEQEAKQQAEGQGSNNQEARADEAHDEKEGKQQKTRAR